MESTGCSSRPHGSLADGAAAACRITDDGQVVPPYWQRHLRDDSVVSIASNTLGNPFIRLVDNTEEGSEQSKALWAKSAEIDDHVVVRGTAPGIGDYVVWNCKIETLNVSSALTAHFSLATDVAKGGVMTLNKRCYLRCRILRYAGL